MKTPLDAPLDWASIVGFCGMACIIGAYAYLTLARTSRTRSSCTAPIWRGARLADDLVCWLFTSNWREPRVSKASGPARSRAVRRLHAQGRFATRRRATGTQRFMIIAVDGPTASGKGTIAKALAAHFGLPHLDTGLLYRAVGRQVALNGGDPDDPRSDALAACDFPDALLDDRFCAPRKPAGSASRVSVHPAVRQALYERQRAFALQPGGAVLDGRDIGTVIAPDAEVKLFVTASVQERARRRWLEMTRHARIDIPLAEIEQDIVRARRARHQPRGCAPCAPRPTRW